MTYRAGTARLIVMGSRRQSAAVEQIPRSCVCTWSWMFPARRGQQRWVRTKAEDNCPWHQSNRPKP